MSLISCDDCTSIIDSDEDPDCFLEVGKYPEDIVLCQWCREKRITEYENLRKEPNDATNT